jgi:hypothetical protein
MIDFFQVKATRRALSIEYSDVFFGTVKNRSFCRSLQGRIHGGPEKHVGVLDAKHG